MNPKYLIVFMGGALLASIALNISQYQRPELTAAQVEPPVEYADLDLTPAQIGVLNRCGMACNEAAEDLREQSAAVTDELRKALSADDLDEVLVKELAGKLCELRNKEVDNNIATLLEVRNTLEPKQVRTLYRVLYSEEGK